MSSIPNGSGIAPGVVPMVDHKHSIHPPQPPPPPPPPPPSSSSSSSSNPLILITDHSLPRTISECLTDPSVAISLSLHSALESWFEKRGNDYQTYSLFDEDTPLSCAVWKHLTFMYFKLNKLFFSSIGKIPPSFSVQNDIRRTLMPMTFGPRFEHYKSLEDVRRSEVAVLRTLSQTGGSDGSNGSSTDKKSWDRDMLKYATNAFWWIRLYFRVIQLYPFEKFDDYLEEKDPSKKEIQLHDYLWKGAFQSPTSTDFETRCRDLIFRNQCPMGAESRYCLSHMINAKHFSVIDVVQHELSPEDMMYVEQQTRIPPREKKVMMEKESTGGSGGVIAVAEAAAAAGKVVKSSKSAIDTSVPLVYPMDHITRDCWMRQMFCGFWNNPTIPKFDMEYMISWDDWKDPVKCLKKLSDMKVAGLKRPPLIMQFGDQFFVHHWRVKGVNGQREPRLLYSTVFKRSLTAALTLWLNIMISEYDRKVGIHTKMPALTFWGEPPDKPKYHLGGGVM